MIKQILIEEGGFTSSYLKVKEKVKKLCEETRETLLIIPSPLLVYDRFIDKVYSIYAICANTTDEYEVKRIKLFLESFTIDYKYKLLERNFPEILQFRSKSQHMIVR